MLTLAQSPLNEHYRELMEITFYSDDSGYIDVTSYGEFLSTLTAAHLLAEFCPYVDTALLPDDEIDNLLWLIAGVPIPPPPPPPPPEQLTLF